MAFIDLVAKIKKYYGFTHTEFMGLLSSMIVMSFIISFREWGRDEFSLSAGLFNWFNAALIVTLVLLVYNFAQKVAGFSVGYKVEYKMWATGLLISLIFAFVSKGRIWLLVPGGIMVHHLAGHRLGHFRYGVNYFQHGMVAVAGTVSLITLAALFKILNTYLDSSLVHKIILFCIIFAIYDILPIPPLSGSRLFIGSRMVYAFMFFTIIFAGVLLLLDINVLMAILGSIVIGVVCWLLYYIFFERKAWQGPWPKG